MAREKTNIEALEKENALLREKLAQQEARKIEVGSGYGNRLQNEINKISNHSRVLFNCRILNARRYPMNFICSSEF